jgi:hypothetical protein
MAKLNHTTTSATCTWPGIAAARRFKDDYEVYRMAEEDGAPLSAAEWEDLDAYVALRMGCNTEQEFRLLCSRDD